MHKNEKKKKKKMNNRVSGVIIYFSQCRHLDKAVLQGTFYLISVRISTWESVKYNCSLHYCRQTAG